MSIVIIVVSFDRRIVDLNDHVVSRKDKVPFSMTIGNGELMHEGFLKHLRMGIARMK